MSEMEKAMSVQDDSQTIGAFLDWLLNERSPSVFLASSTEESEKLYLFHLNIERLLAEYFNIDLKVLENERLKLLQQVRESNQS